MSVTGLSQMADHSRVWIYQADRTLSSKEVELIESAAKDFVSQWAAHQSPLTAGSKVLHNRFLILLVDEQLTGASGCSIDASVHFIQKLGAALHIDFFDRMQFLYSDGKEIKSLHKSQLRSAKSQGEIDDLTMFFDTLVKTKLDLEQEFLKPLKSSWHARLI